MIAANQSSSEFAGVAVDDDDQIYVTGTIPSTGSYKAYMQYILPGRAPLLVEIAGESFHLRRIVVKLKGDGRLEEKITNPEFWGQSILRANNKLYLLESDRLRKYWNIRTYDFSLTELTDGVRAYPSSSDAWMTLASGENSNIYLTGRFGPSSTLTFQEYKLVPPGYQNITDLSLSTTAGNVFIAKLDEHLEWQWTKKLACGHETPCSEPEEFGLPSISANGNLNFLAGSFDGTLRVGDEPEYAVLTAEKPYEGYIGMLDNDGNFAMRYSLVVNSLLKNEPFAADQIAMKIDGETVSFELGEEKELAAGTHVRIEADEVIWHDINGQVTSDENQVATKTYCEAYDIDGAVADASKPPYICEFVIGADTVVDFGWRTHHGLNISQGFSDTGPQSDDKGQPEPSAGTHWNYEEGELVVPSPTILACTEESGGIRYNVVGYRAEGFRNSAREALVFDGADDWLYVPYSFHLDDFTVSFYAKFSELNELQPIFNKGPMSIAFTAENRMRFTVKDYSLDTPNAYADQGWHHWAFVYGSGNGSMAIYLDGNIVAGGVNANAANYSDSSAATIGYHSGARFKGALDEFRIWPFRRSTSDIREDRKVTPIPNAASMSVYYRFDKPGGATSTLIDESGHGRESSCGFPPASYSAKTCSEGSCRRVTTPTIRPTSPPRSAA